MIKAETLKLEIAKGNAGIISNIAIVPSPTSFKGASIDLHLGRWFCLLQQSRLSYFSFEEDTKAKQKFTHSDIFVEFYKPFYLHPGRFVLASTLEWIRMPADRAAFVTGKSNIGRRDLVIETAPGVHPFFKGCLTLEIVNLGEIPLAVYPGMPICQLFIQETDSCEGEEESQFASQIKPSFGSNG